MFESRIVRSPSSGPGSVDMPSPTSGYKLFKPEEGSELFSILHPSNPNRNPMLDPVARAASTIVARIGNADTDKIYSDEGVISLAAEGRTPFFYEGCELSGGDRIVVVPPLGTTPDDTTVLGFHGITFIGPDGRVRRDASVKRVDSKTADEIAVRINAISLQE
jgi:hypothetical protein